MAMTDPKTSAARKGGILARFRSWFLTGLLVTAPVLLTVYITWTAVQLIDNQVAGLLPWVSQNSFTSLPGVGLIIGVVLITLIGAVAAGFLGRWIIRLGESILNRMPVVRSIYGAIKQILETVISTQSDAFREVILVEYPRRGMWGHRVRDWQHQRRGGTPHGWRDGECVCANHAEPDIRLFAVLPA